MFIAWTTVATLTEAETLARGALELRLAVCAQIDGPVVSQYWWEGRLERAAEYRLMFKCPPARLAALETWVLARHPYQTPEWLAVRAERVGEKYLSWARAASISNPF